MQAPRKLSRAWGHRGYPLSARPSQRPHLAGPTTISSCYEACACVLRAVANRPVLVSADSDYGWRYRFLGPAGVTVLVLSVAILAAFIATSSYIGSVTSEIHLNQSKTTPSGVARAPHPRTAPASLPALLAKVRGAVWTVHTFDANGEPVTGSAFAVVSSSTQTFLITSYVVVAAAVYQPAPLIQVAQGGGAGQQVTLRLWDQEHDLALLVLGHGNEPVLQGTDAHPPLTGQQVYVISGGAAGASISTDKVVDGSTLALEEDAPPAGVSPGSPVIDISGSVLGIDASYEPLHSTPLSAGARFVVPIRDTCAVVLVCPGGSFPAG